MADPRPEIWDCIVVGAGVVGSWTAYHLTKNGKKTLLIDQFALPHTRGSSHGQSRIIRTSYAEPRYVAMMPESFALWDQLEKECGKTLFRRTGMLNIEAPGLNKIGDVKAAMVKNGAPFEELTGEEIKKRYPMLDYPKDFKGLLDPSAGMLLNDRCLAVLRERIVKQGGVIRDAEPVKEIYPGSHVTVVTDNGKYVTKKIVITPGPWANDILKNLGVDLPLKTMPGRSFYWRDLTEGEYDLEKGCPLVTHTVEEKGGYRFYCLFPSMEYQNSVKIVTRGEPSEFYCHPNDRDIRPMSQMKSLLQTYVATYLPGIEPAPSIEEAAMYTMTPDGGYVIDQHPLYTNIIIGCGMSGHGFKTSPVTGKLLSEMAQEKPTSYDIEALKMKRFGQKSKL
ncbi:hypothetical protein CAPTEDRAFT_169754 [Capitella teleta]|uniref:sarcosine oxidasee (formaldehyde-forming) n=1 Tax=Capitella teleta TaxID=283909 RepID=R7UDL2_CAPTE|nr:hypothetical protein CAPTEDRAFT_169754 [Capitella teleta]|eukprot:ELU01878.1 hypothetical protein CAPTEDRAFT_169754 [Capitella teleta]